MKPARLKHPEVQSITTLAMTITAQPGQWFCETVKRWELWDQFAGREVLIRRIPKKNILSMDRKTIPAQKFEVKQDVVLSLPKNAEWKIRKAYGHIVGMNPTGDIIGVDIPKPPEWMYSLLRQRGIFMSGPIALQLFMDHKGTWTDIHGFNHYKIV